MSLDIPVSVNILGVVGLITGDLNLLETPLWQVDIASTEIAAKNSVFKSEGCSQGSDLSAITRSNVTDDLHSPVILLVANGSVSVT